MVLLLNLLTIASTNPLVERLLLVSIELTATALLVWAGIRVLRIRSARVIALLWMLVLTKAIFGFVTGQRLAIWDLKIDNTRQTPAAIARSLELAAPGEYAATPAAPFQNGSFQNGAGAQSAAAAGFGRGGAIANASAAAAPAAYAPDSLAHALMKTGRYVILTSSMVGGILAALWMLGMGTMLAVTIRDLLMISRLYRSSELPSASLAKTFDDEKRRLKVKAAPRLRISEEIVTPALVGWFRPVVLLPSWIAEEMAPAQMRWLLGHELMHWKHFDTLGLLVRRAAQTIFWFHPAVWIAGQRWEHAMERACDRALVADMDQARDYAQQLYGVLHKVTRRKALPTFSTGLFVTRTQVGRRIELLLTNPLGMPAQLGFASMGSLLLLAALTLPAGIALTDATDEAPQGSHALDMAQDQGQAATDTPQAAAAAAPPLITLTSEQMNGWLRIDLGDQRSPPGWVPWSAVNLHGINEHTSQAFSVPFDAYFEIEISHDVLWRRDPHSDEADPQDLMLRDGVRSFGEIRLTFRDLDPGDYDLAPVSFSPESFGDRPVKFDATLNGNPILRGIPTGDRSDVSKSFAPTIRFTVNDRPDEDQTEVTVGFKPQGGPLWLSGFMLRKAGNPFGDAISRIETANGKAYNLASAAIGEKAYIDREYTIVSLPPDLEHQILIQTANDDKTLVSNREVTLEVTRPATVYLCYAAYEDRMPDWTAGFEATGDEVLTTDQVFEVYSKRFPAGTIVLGGNRPAGLPNYRAAAAAPSQYLAIVVPDAAPDLR